MRISVRSGISAIVIGCVLASGGGAQLAWQRVADHNSRMLACRLSRQVADAVERDVDARIGEAEAAYGAMRTILTEGLVAGGDTDRREVLFLSQIMAHQAVSWVAFAEADSSFFGAHRLGDDRLEMVEIHQDARPAVADQARRPVERLQPEPSAPSRSRRS